jgi:hypothetical protein
VNVRRGLFRVWILASVLWTVIILAYWGTYYVFDLAYYYFGYLFPFPFLADEFKLMLVPWALTAAGFLIRWAYKGFRAN